MEKVKVYLTDSKKELQLPAVLTEQDQTLRDSLVEYYPGVADSVIRRYMRGKERVIEITENVKPKGGALDQLQSAPESINPAYQMYLELVKLQAGAPHIYAKEILQRGDEIEQAYRDGQEFLAAANKSLEFLRNANPIIAQAIPCGW